MSLLEPMRIQFMVEGFTPSENAHANLCWLLELAIKEVGCPPDAVTDVIVTDKAHFGEAIDLLAPGFPYTDNENFVAVAKTIRLCTNATPPASGIVLRDFIVNGAFLALDKDPTARSAEDQRFIYAVWHEVAHALDASNQPAERAAPESPVTLNRLFKVSHVAAFFEGVVLSEIAACRLAAFVCSQAMLELEMDSDRESLNRMLAALKGHTLAHDGDPDDHWRIALEAAQFFWLPFVQYGKAIAHMAGNSQLHPAIVLWEGCPPEVQGILTDYVALLNDTFALYPSVPADFAERLTALWARMAAAYGFSFPAGEDEDGVHWQWPNSPDTGA